MEVDWDLQAVVRGCRFVSTNPPPCLRPINQVRDSASCLDFCLSNHFIPSDVVSPPTPPPQPQEELTDFILPFLHASEPPVTPSEPLKRPSTTSSPAPRSKRRKNQFKKVCEVPAERLASDDTWSWRKYGQKPIKGSPHPRGYYRCSSSKGCPARKQVERNKSDSSMFIVTYTAEHNHPAPTHRHINHQKLGPKRSNSSSSAPTSPSDNDEDHQSVIKLEHCLDDIVFEEGIEEGCVNGAVEDDFFDGLDEIDEGMANTAHLSYSSLINAPCIW